MFAQERMSKRPDPNAFLAQCPALPAPNPRPAARAPERLRRCPDCGCGRLRTRGHKLVLDPRGVVFPNPVAALDCDDCGRLYAVDDVWNRRAELGSRPVSHLVAQFGCQGAAQADREG